MIHLGDMEALAHERGEAMRQSAGHERLLRLARQYRAATASTASTASATAARQTVRTVGPHAWDGARLSGQGVLLRVLLALIGPLRAIPVN